MAYTTQTWDNTGVAPNGIATAARLNHMESGIKAAHDAVDAIVSPKVHFEQKAADTTRNVDTFSDDPDLVFPVLAGELWVVEYMIVYQADTTSDIRVSIGGPGGGATIVGSAEGIVDTATGRGGGRWMTTVTGFNFDEPYAGIGIGAGLDVHVRMSMTIKVGTAGGNVGFRWCRKVVGSVGTVVKAGSNLLAVQVIES